MSNYNSIRNSHSAQSTTVSDRFLTMQNADGRYCYKNADYSSCDDHHEISLVSASTAIPANLANAQVD